MFGGERDDGEAADAHEGRAGEKLAGFDFGESDWFGDGFSGFDFDGWLFGVGGGDGDDRGGAYGGFLIAGVVDDQFVAGLHFAEIFHGGGIGDAVPSGLFVALEIGEGIGGRLGFQQVVGRHGVTSV